MVKPSVAAIGGIGSAPSRSARKKSMPAIVGATAAEMAGSCHS